MPTSPVIEWRNSTTPFATISTLALSGTGFSGAIPIGTASTVVTVRLYNNFAASGGIADATSCTLTTYDDAVHQGAMSTSAVIGLYCNVQCLDYNGTTTGQDSTYVAIGGLTKHVIPVNSGTIGGTGSNYVTINLKVVIPTSAVQGAVSQGVWVEYNSVA